MKKIILFLLFIFLSVQLVSAVDVFSFWVDNGDNRIEIQEGESTDFYVRSTGGMPFDIRIWLENEEGNQIYEFLDINYDDGEENGDNVIYVNVFSVLPDNYINPGNYEIHFFANDGFMPDNDEILFLNVIEGENGEDNNNPTAIIDSPNGNIEIVEGNEVEFRGHGTDGDGDRIISYEWNINDEIINEQSFGYVFNEIGEYEVSLRVQDEHDLWSINNPTRIINVIEVDIPNNPPEVTLIYPNGGEVLSGVIDILWEGTDVDVDELSINIEYSKDNGINWRPLYTNLENDGSEEWNTAGYSNGDNYLLRITVNDGEISVSDVSDNVFTLNNIDNENPIAYIDSPENNYVSFVGELVEFRGHGTDEDGDEIIEYEWMINDEIINEQNFYYRFDNAGEYDISFKVQDEYRLWSDSVNVHVIILNLNNPPVINIESPRERETIRDVYTIEWDAQDDGNIINTKIYYKKLNEIPLIGHLINLFRDYELLVELQGNPGSYNWDTIGFRNGAYSLGIVVTDDDGSEGQDIVERFVIINIRGDENHAPEINSIPITEIVVNTQYIYDIDAFDVDGDEIRYGLGRYFERMDIDSNTGVLTWLPKEVGEYVILVIASDGELFDSQKFVVNVLPEEFVPEVIPTEPRKLHEFSISNIILDQDNEYIKVYVQIKNKGNQDESIELKVFNMNIGGMAVDSFNLEDNNNDWRILNLPKPKVSGIYTIGVWGNSKDFKDTLYREIMVV